jgi:hypothetical protein
VLKPWPLSTKFPSSLPLGEDLSIQRFLHRSKADGQRGKTTYFVEKLLNLPAFFRSHVEADMEYAAA